MAIYHASMKVFVRSKGQTATGAAAYRAGFCIVDERTGLTHDYTRRGGVVHTETLAPQGAPAWASDLDALWNAAEKAEARKDARVARELEVSLPSELNDNQRAALASSLASLLVERYGTAVLMAIHAPGKGDARNHHVHLLMPTRVLNANGLGAKIRVLDEPRTGPGEVRALREAVADITNRHLARAGLSERVDHRTLKAQADDAAARGDYARAIVLTRRPTVHLGRSITAMRRRNLLTSDANMHVRASNQIMFSDFLLSARSASALRIGPTSRVRTARPAGPGARVIAVQARLARQQNRDHERAHRRFVAMLERTRVAIAEQDRKTLWAYCQAFQRSLSDAQALAFHGERDPGSYAVLRRAVAARQAVERAEATARNQRRAAGEAMVRTAQERSTLQAIDAEPAPSRLRILSRRQWAEKRRNQRVAVSAAELAERKTVRTDRDAAQAQLRSARVALAEVEAQRRRTYGVPGDEPNANNTIETKPRALPVPGPGPVPSSRPVRRGSPRL